MLVIQASVHLARAGSVAAAAICSCHRSMKSRASLARSGSSVMAGSIGTARAAGHPFVMAPQQGLFAVQQLPHNDLPIS